jgi:DNA-binding transcriptional regulator YhcF (GntR family)
MQITKRVRVAVNVGDLAFRAGFLTVHALATRMRLNPSTIAHAFRDLENEGFVTTRTDASVRVSDIDADTCERVRAVAARRFVREAFAASARLGIESKCVQRAMAAEIEDQPA